MSHVVQRDGRLHEPLAAPYRGSELVAHGQDGQALAGRPVLASVGHGLDLDGHEKYGDGKWAGGEEGNEKTTIRNMG